MTERAVVLVRTFFF